MSTSPAKPVLTKAQLEAKVAELTAALAAKKAAPPVSMKVGTKGGISIYGLGRFPVSLYRSQMEKFVELAKSGKIDEFISAHADKLATKAAA
jgi:hypothetical protein